MSSKLPVPVFYRRSSTQIKEETKTLSPTPSKTSLRGAMDGKKNDKNAKYSNILPRVVTHWSDAEKQRNGLKNFFERKTGTSSASSSATTSPNTSATTTTTTSKSAKGSRQSLPMACDPITVAIAQLKRNTRFYSFSESVSTTSSISSVVNYADAEENN